MTNFESVGHNRTIYRGLRRNALPTDDWMTDDWILIQDELTDHISKSEEIIAIYVGGTRYEVLKKNFAYWPTTRLSKMIRAKTNQDILKYCDGTSNATSQRYQEFYFRKNWSNFNSILGKRQGYHFFFKLCHGKYGISDG